MKLIILSAAQQELADAIAYYEQIEPGLGLKLRDEVGANVAWILQHPNTPRPRPRGYYRVNLRTFPYYLPYVIRTDTIWIVAVAHARRRPLYWINRHTGE